MMSYYIGCFKKFAQFKGRARRKEYWFFVLFDIIVKEVLGMGAYYLGEYSISGGLILQYIFYAYCLVSIIPFLSVATRRVHDAGNAMPWIFVPLFNLFIFLTAGTIGENKYGPDPIDRNMNDSNKVDMDKAVDGINNENPGANNDDSYDSVKLDQIIRNDNGTPLDSNILYEISLKDDAEKANEGSEQTIPSFEMSKYALIYRNKLTELSKVTDRLVGNGSSDADTELFFIAWMGYGIAVLRNDSSIAKEFVEARIDETAKKRYCSPSEKDEIYRTVWSTCNRLEFLSDQMLGYSQDAGAVVVLQSIDFLKTNNWEASDYNQEIVYKFYFDVLQEISQVVRGEGSQQIGNSSSKSSSLENSNSSAGSVKPRRKSKFIIAIICVLIAVFGIVAYYMYSQNEYNEMKTIALQEVMEEHPTKTLNDLARENGATYVRGWETIKIDANTLLAVYWYEVNDEKYRYGYFAYECEVVGDNYPDVYVSKIVGNEELEEKYTDLIQTKLRAEL